MKEVHFVPSQNEKYANMAFRILHSGEPGLFLFPPNTNKSNHFIDFLISQNGSEFDLVKFDLAVTDLDNADSLKTLLKKKVVKSKKKKLAIFITNARNLILEKKFTLINSIFDVLEPYPNLALMFFFNVDITHPEIAKHLRTRIFSNIAYFPLFSRIDVMNFINFLVRELDLRLLEKDKTKIANYCGGYFWLVKQAMRALRDNPNLEIEDLLKSERVRVALEQLYNSLLDTERNALQSLIQRKKIDSQLENHSREYLERVGMIIGNKIAIPFFEEYIREYLPSMEVELKDNKIFLNLVNVDGHFSQKERRVFKALLAKKSQTVARDELAKAIWPINTDDFYSDWAVDRIVSRLRSKIKLLGFPKDVIKTQRNRGYMFGS